MNARKERSATIGFTWCPWSASPCTNWCPPTSRAPIQQRSAITAVTTGPAIATRNSCPGVRVSPRMRATPPNSQRSIPAMPMPFRIATTACPSSWSTTERKNRSALTVASTKAFVL